MRSLAIMFSKVTISIANFHILEGIRSLCFFSRFAP